MSRAYSSPWVMTLSVALLSLAPIQSVRGLTLCATSVSTLQARLDTADSNMQADTIRIAVGNYPVSSLVYAGDTEPFDLTLSGGWNVGCTVQSSNSPFDTELSGNTLNSILHVSLSGGRVFIENLRFRNGMDLASSPVRIVGKGNSVRVQVERSVFSGNTGSAGALFILHSLLQPAIEEVRIRNNLFRGNHAIDTAVVTVNPGSAAKVYFTNNTVVDNTHAGGIASLGGVHININGGATVQIFVANNILWNNQGTDLRVGFGDPIILRNNNIEDRVIQGPLTEDTMSLSVDPLFISQPLLFVPAFGSPMIDAGAHPPFSIFPVPFAANWTPGMLDAAGEARVQGPKVDIGAFEATPDIIFADGYE